MKLVITYLVGLILAWLGLNAILVALAYWGVKGAFLPLIVGFFTILLAMRLLMAAVRLYFKSPSGGSG